MGINTFNNFYVFIIVQALAFQKTWTLTHITRPMN